MASELTPICFKRITDLAVTCEGIEYLVSIRAEGRGDVDARGRSGTYRYVIDIVSPSGDTYGSVYYIEGPFKLPLFKIELVAALIAMPKVRHI